MIQVAERRMFAKTIIDSDAFLDMPLSSQALYFHLSMRADDDGFINNPKKIQRMIGGSDDDLKLLIAKNFIIPFESGIVVIKHWKIHNYIRGDRKKETVYPEEMALLEVKDNGAYTLSSSLPAIESFDDTETARQKAYKESNLPYSFEYKIRQAFTGRNCPICGAKMQEEIDNGIVTRNRIASIQHNIPISKGGKHELGNISVICKECNVTIKDTITDKLNAQEVIEVWDVLTGKCQTSDRQMSDKCHTEDRLGKDSIVKDSINIYSDSDESQPIPATPKRKVFVPPTVEEVEAYCYERNNNVNAQGFVDFYESKGWMVGKNKMKDWKAAVRTWENSSKSSNRTYNNNSTANMLDDSYRMMAGWADS